MDIEPSIWPVLREIASAANVRLVLGKCGLEENNE